MIHSVSPWTATVQSDIEVSEPLFIVTVNNYIYKIYNTGDSLWLTCDWPLGGSIAFRIAFGMNSNFEKVAISEVDSILLITARTRLGNYRITLSFPEDQNNSFRYTTTLQTTTPLIIPFWPRDIVPLTKNGKIENTSGKIHASQIGGRSGQLYFSMTKPKNGTVFYFQNLSAMSAYCEVCETNLTDTVGGAWPEIGFQFPVNSKKPLPAEKEFIISDAFVLLSQQIPEEDSEITKLYLECLANVYLQIPKPTVAYHDYPTIADNCLNDLYHNKGCWTQTNGVSYLNAYVCDYETPTEVMVQLAVLQPLNEYLEWLGKSHPLADELGEGISAFFDDRIKTLTRWLPALEDDLDKSEEQKGEMVMDSWYLHHPLMNLCRLAINGDTNAKKLFLKSIDFAIKVAHHFDYEWPVFYKMTTLEVLKAETSEGNGGEKDVPGSYAHLMLLAWHLTNEKRFLNEAVKAVKHLDGLAFNIFYQANNTAFTSGALVELYKETKDIRYLELSYCCLAGVFKNMQLWECNYGYGKNFPTFFSVFPLNDAPYTAAYEELEVYAALHNYIHITEGIEILPALKILIPEFLKYAVGRLAFYYPTKLPPEMLAEKSKTGEIKNDLWIPLEDIHDGWKKSGEVGQEVYGAGLAFGIVPRQYCQIKALNVLAFIDYPVTTVRQGKNSLTFKIIGNPQFKATIVFLQNSSKHIPKLNVQSKIKLRYEKVNAVDNKNTRYEVNANAAVKITW
ncbi:hypothetical protein [Flavobacterium sp.]|uniref:hypothetical protein n=1 Tax=Flavobacterium sp. TaxID=239 RepID=UPI003C3A295D